MDFLAIGDLRTSNHSLSRLGWFMDCELLATNGTARDYELCGALTQPKFESFIAPLRCTRFCLESRFSRSGSSRLDTQSRIASMRARSTPKKALCDRFCRIAWQKFRLRKAFLMIPRNSRSIPITEA